MTTQVSKWRIGTCRMLTVLTLQAFAVGLGGSTVMAQAIDSNLAQVDVVQQQDTRSVTIAKPGPNEPMASPKTPLLASFYTERIDWGNKNGWWILTLYDWRITANSRVYVSFSEADGGGNRFIGSAVYTIHNVAPRNGAVSIRVFVNWGSPLHTVVDYLVVQP
ncbi:hypothetical protein [Chitinivorax sp. B]|uniref:hypothetical protein n=1 Tax=Chitinivorax sp. B TaxID=2502235 RepID=UPI0010F4D279|nr:hypothetical protein [Chitinivorax sp. B]